MVADFIHSVISSSVPIILAALGGMFTHLVGKLNIALEGMMLTAAFMAIYIADKTKSFLTAILVSISICCIYAMLIVIAMKLKANIFLAGLAINLFANGLTSFLMVHLFGSKGTVVSQNVPIFNKIELPFINDVPFIGKILSGYNVLEYITFILVFVCYAIVNKTVLGYQIKAVGKDAIVARNLGIDVDKMIITSFLLSGLFTGLAGAVLSLPMRSFVSGMSNNRGWIALVAVIIGGERVFTVVLSCLIFGLFSFLSSFLQLFSKIPAELLMAVPYIFTTVVILIYAYLKKSKAGVRI
ncbi:ABC transporter permease [Thermotoga profunda]|uniref:ABC transporter permease n=1 Tax=Thermotoga profunda TaxID=1508420 RepID=UPI000597D920|nr:ABC transporter permease [Thermotoga profunda]